jgi:hypothetical protein
MFRFVSVWFGTESYSSRKVSLRGIYDRDHHHLYIFGYNLFLSKNFVNAYRILVGMPEGMRPLGRPIRRWVDNIKMDLREIGRDGMDWIYLAQNRDQWRALVNTEMNLRVP